MKWGICPDCKKWRPLTKHSKIGNHKPPYIYKCRECHDKIHHMFRCPYKKRSKYQPGTYFKKKKHINNGILH